MSVHMYGQDWNDRSIPCWLALTPSFCFPFLRWAGRKVQQINDPGVKRHQKNWYSNVIRAIAESGALYTMSIATTIVISCSIVSMGSLALGFSASQKALTRLVPFRLIPYAQPGSAPIFGYIQAMIAGITPTMLVLVRSLHCHIMS